MRACVCARVQAEVGEKRRHLLLPGLAVGRDGAAVTLAFAVHACAESSSHCHAPVNPSQPPREQPRPHGDPRSHPHYWPLHAKAPPPSSRQRARLTGLPLPPAFRSARRQLQPKRQSPPSFPPSRVPSLLPSQLSSLLPLSFPPPPSEPRRKGGIRNCSRRILNNWLFSLLPPLPPHRPRSAPHWREGAGRRGKCGLEFLAGAGRAGTVAAPDFGAPAEYTDRPSVPAALGDAPHPSLLFLPALQSVTRCQYPAAISAALSLLPGVSPPPCSLRASRRGVRALFLDLLAEQPRATLLPSGGVTAPQVIGAAGVASPGSWDRALRPKGAPGLGPASHRWPSDSQGLSAPLPLPLHAQSPVAHQAPAPMPDLLHKKAPVIPTWPGFPGSGWCLLILTLGWEGP